MSVFLEFPTNKPSNSLSEVLSVYKPILNSQIQAICLLDHKFKIQQCSPALLTLLDMDFHALKYRAFNMLSPAYQESLGFILQNITEGELHEDILNAVFIKDDGSSLLLNCRFIGIRKDGKLEGILVFVENYTEKASFLKQNKTLQKSLAETNSELAKYIDSNAQLEHFAYIASHDLREPLRTISNFAQLMERKLTGKLDESTKDYLDYIIKGAQNMNAMVGDLLSYSRVNTQDHRHENIAIDETLRIIQKDLHQLISETGATINIGKMPLNMIANATKMKQLFQNLIHNAIKFQKEDSTPVVDIAAWEDRNYWYFSLKDNGIGIAEEHHKEIFLLFKKLNAGVAGTGIGLSLCEKIIKQHGGKLSLDSKLDEGTIFFFSISKHLD